MNPTMRATVDRFSAMPRDCLLAHQSVAKLRVTEYQRMLNNAKRDLSAISRVLKSEGKT